ncbi:hypothetical protein AN639_07965 [Candidatus Epulonipiscium fishelsonii]|uniref:Uncharacterized protein n=1 Tax=Candidatus Epulonipiscium fishelsonii TaxID=77094 RepID=A0ACC8X7I1_9FIRM|nr:hypothetical protein AN396_12675 [Epulopiscium sp. SCG-B11WGA-EpuloA1]ONI38325.1 hypothetical protein AN639_07965 [Epulopiscium sp. SCG-B05WGA-EpuloA1]
MGKLKDFFKSFSFDEIISDEPSYLSINSLVYPELLTISSQLNKLEVTKEYGKQIELMAYNITIDKSVLEEIILGLTDLNQQYKTKLMKTQDPVDVLHEYLDYCIEIARYTISDDPPTYENFIDNENFELIKKTLIIVINVQKLIDVDENLQQLINDYAIVFNTLNQLTPTVQEFLPIANTLKTEITEFTNVVTQVKSQNKMSPDWNGKKTPLIQLRQQLVKKREQFIIDEENVNGAILKVYTECQKLHEQFKEVSLFIIAEIQEIINTSPRDNEILMKRQEVANISQIVSTSLLQIENFRSKI